MAESYECGTAMAMQYAELPQWRAEKTRQLDRGWGENILVHFLEELRKAEGPMHGIPRGTPAETPLTILGIFRAMCRSINGYRAKNLVLVISKYNNGI